MERRTRPEHIEGALLFALVFVGWLVLVVSVFVLLGARDTRPGPRTSDLPIWPSVPIVRPAGTWTLVMIAHPRCACTQASIAELERLVARLPEEVRVHVLFVEPADASGWSDTSLRRRAERVARVQVHTDPEGRMAEQFGVLTSGHVLLFGPDGEARFSGGITPARGHEGASPGRSAILRLLDENLPDSIQADAFGCPVKDQDV